MKPAKTSYDFHQLEVLCAVIDAGSFSGAAVKLGLTQPTVSTHVAAMEKSTGVALIDRRGRKAQPTAAGRMLYSYARKMLSVKEETDRALVMLNELVTGQLVMGGSNIPGTYFLPAEIAEFRKLHSGVSVVLRIGDTQEVVDMVESGEVELGVVGRDPGQKNIKALEMWEDELVLVASPEHRWSAAKSAVPLKSLAEEPMLMREKGSATRDLMEKILFEKGLKPKQLNAVCELGSTEAVKQGVIGGAGVAVISKNAVRAEVKAGLLCEIPVRGLKFKRHFFLIQDTRRAESAAAGAFAKFLTGK